MRIAYLTGEYPRATDTFIQREVAALRDCGVEIFTFSVRRTADEHIVGSEQETEREGTFYLLPPDPLRMARSHIALLVRSPKRYLRSLKLAWTTRQAGLRGHAYQIFYFAEAGILARQLQSRRVGHLHNHFANSSCTVAMLAAELSGISFSFTMHGPAIFFEPRRWRIDEKIRRALFVACISRYSRSQGMIFAPVERWDRMHIVHCGVDPALHSPSEHHDGSRRLLYVGRLGPTKGLPILLEALSTLKSSQGGLSLTIVGDGPDRISLEEMAATLGVGEMVRFVGYQSQEEVRDQLRHTDVFVLPSFAEGVPVVLMEAMAAGVPVVGTRVAGTSELVEEGVNGFLVPPGDVASLAERIAQLLGDAQLRTRLGAAARTKVEQEFNIYREAAWLWRVMRAAFEGKVEAIRPS
jgi:glycosyltransferase involved in cell wall biosynthesis